MEEFEIEFKELDQFEIEDVREVVVQEVPTFPALENLTITPTAEEQIFNHENSYGYDEVKVEAVQGKSLEVIPSKEEQTFSDLYTNVKVNAIQTESLEVNPTTENQEFNGIYNNVKVNAVTSEIDSNIVAENIKNDVEILGVKGSFVGSKYAPRYIYNGNFFYDYTGTELDYEITNLDVSNITNMDGMFNQAYNLKSLDLSSWDTTNVTNMSNMFRYVGQNSQSFTLNLGGKFNTANVTNMYAMFTASNKLKTLILDNFDTRKVTNMSQMFYDCAGLETLNLSSWDTSNVTNMSNMIDGCYNLKFLDIRNFTFDKVTKYSRMFQYIPAGCLIIVKSDTERNWILTNGRSDLTNIKTVAEYEAS